MSEVYKVYLETDNMCDYCRNCFATCPSSHVEFGEGVGHDNVIGCDTFYPTAKVPLNFYYEDT